MKILVQCDYYADIIECPEYIGENIKQLQQKFDKWLNNPESNHNLWFHDEEQGDALCFDAGDFVSWINQYHLKDANEKVIFIAKDIQPTKEDKKLPIIYI